MMKKGAPVLGGVGSLIFALVVGLGAVGCEGAAGTAGKDGANGLNGADGVDGTDGQDGQNGQPGQDAIVDQSLSPIEKAFVFMGGKGAYAGIDALRVTSTGARWAVGEGYLPDDEPLATGTFQLTASHDLAADDLRLDYQRDLLFLGIPAKPTYSEIMKGQLGYVQGSDSLFGAPEVGNMPSDRWGATRRQHRILNPHLVLRDVAKDPSLATDAGAEVVDGILYHRVKIADPIAPITLYVSSATGRIAKLHTWDNSYLLRDVDVEVFFEAWSATPEKIAFPQAVYVAYDGHIIHQDARTGIEINPPLDTAIFDLPAGANPMYDAEAAKRGAASHQFHEMFEAVGIALDGPQNLTNPIPIAPGVVQLQGGAHNVGIIEQSAGLVMLDAPIHDLRSKAVLAWAKTTYPNKPITHVIVTHFHEDHSGGVREMAAAGAKIVVGEASADLFRRALKATSTVYPDTLSGVQIDTKIIEVADDGVFTIEDAMNPVRAYHVRSAHAADMLVAYATNTQALWVTDIYGAQSPPGLNPSFIPYAKELHDSIVDVHKIPVSLLFTGHGFGSNTFAQFKQVIGVP